MSELMNARKADFRRQLLATASVFALLASVYGVRETKASDSDGDQPVVWIELGGQLEGQTGQGDAFIPDFVANNLSSPGFKGFDFQASRPNNFSNGLEGKIAFEPTNSDWVFSASVRYGRSNGRASLQHVTPGHHLHPKSVFKTYTTNTTGYRYKHFRCCRTRSYTPDLDHAYASLQSRTGQTHAIVDFQAGKDVGLGMFGTGGSSVLSAGVRFAQFISRSDVAIHGRPSNEFEKEIIQTVGYTITRYHVLPSHRYTVTEDSARNFRGVGPTISWNAPAPLHGNSQSGEIELNWGANAAVLFGRQRVAGMHRTYAVYVKNTYPAVRTGHYSTAPFNRNRTVMVPNFGGFAGLSWRLSNVKVSAGYRGDFFFGAMDVGNDTRKTETIGFYGPFATISVGLGG